MNKKTLQDLRVGESCILTNDREANPKLGAKLLSDGRASLFLDFYFGFTMVYSNTLDKVVPKKQKRRESLNLYIWQKPRTPQERLENRETLAQADRIRRERANDIQEPDKKEALQTKKPDVNFLDYMQEYIDNYAKSDVRVLQMALNRFKAFLHDTPEYSTFEKSIKPNQIDCFMVEDFTDYLKNTSKGEGAKTIYQRFKKMVRYAVANDVMRKNPCINKQGQNITIKVDDGAIVKDVLSPEEIKRLIDTHYPKENMQVRNAFLFSLNTGMRWCDVKELTYGDFDFPNRTFSYNQNKTKGHSSKSNVSLPLTDTLLRLMGEQPEAQDKSLLVFPLPSHTMALKALRRWTKFAGIEKHITFHCTRHSFGTNMAATAAQKGLSIRVVQDMMGHSSLRYTERYTRVMDEQKKQAMTELSKLMEG